MTFEEYFCAYAAGFLASCDGYNGEICPVLGEDRHAPTLELLSMTPSFREEAREAWEKWNSELEQLKALLAAQEGRKP